jgi:hypothetical protein
VAICTLCVVRGVFAAEISFKILPVEDVTKNTTTVEVRIDPHSKKLNVVEGEISVQGIASTTPVEVDTAGSVLTMWPVSPTYIPGEQLIRFTGGVPNGFDKESLLFRVRIHQTLESDAVPVAWVSGTAYLNDGKGTKEAISTPSGDTTFPYNAILIGLGILALIIIALRYVFTKSVEK